MSSEQEFKCVFCSEAFPQKEDLQIHFRKHGDPNFNQKKQIERSQNDADTPAEKSKEQNMEVVECDVCPEVFTTISKAITHKHKMHPDHDTKYFCPWCGKLFTMKHLFKKHIQATHKDKVGSEDRLFHCDSCEVHFNGFAAMNYHNKFYHRQDDLPILGHSKKLKMILEEVVQIYYCPFCGEENDNKVNLHKHINEDHSSENQRPSDVFRCPLCDAIFYYLDAYELHLTYHSSEDLYTERSPLMDEITEFSLETVQPLEENIESAEPNFDQDAAAMKIEDLLEFTMNDSNDTRKSKKRKKHKKSKKPAITLDEFLSMNKDVFGEGIDFQGVEEVPTQVIAKRFKTKKASTSQLMSPDIMKLKKQGIVVKKQATKTGKPTARSNASVKTGMTTKKNLNPAVQAKSKALTSTDAVLSKLLNQGSQIKIVKKTNQDSKELQQKQDNTDTEKSTESMVDKKDEDNNIQPDFTDAESKNIKTILEKKNSDYPEMKSSASSPIRSSPGSPSLVSCNKDIDTLQKSDEDSNNITNHKDVTGKSLNALQKPIKFTDNIIALQNNSNITLKLPKQNIFMNEDNYEDSNKVAKTKVKEAYSQENTEKTTSVSTSTSENSSLNALKHLSHLITVKSINSNKVTSNSDIKLENSSHKVEIMKTAPNVQNNSSKISEINNISNVKNLDGITIKSNQSNLDTLKNQRPVASNDDFNEHNETDGEWHEDDPNYDNKIDTELAPSAQSPQLSIQTKHSPKTIQKESPKGVLSNDQNSQSSVDLLKHLKNVTAKPVNLNSQKIPTPQCSPSSVKKNITNKTLVQKEISEDGTEIFSIDDSDSDEGHVATSANKTESKSELNKSVDVPKTVYKAPAKSINQQNKNIEIKSKKVTNDSSENSEFEKELPTNVSNNKFSSPTPNQKNVAINNVLKNLSRNITVKSRNSSPNLSVQSEHISKDSYLKINEADSDSDTPLNRVKITEIENMSDDELPEENADSDDFDENVKIEHPDDMHSDHDEVPTHEEPDGMADIESQIASSKLQKDNTMSSTNLVSFKKSNKDSNIKSSNNKAATNNTQENVPTDEIPSFAKNLSNQISIKQIKKPENKNVEETAQSLNQSSVNQKMATSSNQVNTFNKEVKTVKTFQTQTKTVIQEITTTVTKTIKTVNQTTKQEVRNIQSAQSGSSPITSQKIQGINTSHVQNTYQGMKVRQSAPCIRPQIRGQAPQTMRPAICPPPQTVRPAICAPKANQLVPVRTALNRPSGPRSRMPNVVNVVRPSTSGHQRPQMTRPVKVSPRAVFTPPKNVETPGHFSCFKKPKESLIPEPDFENTDMTDEDTTAQFSSTMQMSKSNISSTSKIVKGNSVVKSTQMKSEMCASSQQLSKLRGVSGLVVKSSQAKQTQVEEKSEMSTSKRNTLEAIQKLQSQGLLVKKPRFDISEDSDYSQHGSDGMEHDSNEEFN